MDNNVQESYDNGPVLIRSSMKKSFLLPSIVAGSLLVLTLSCKESLPPGGDPPQVLEAYTYNVYAISLQENMLKAYMTVVNTFDETFDAPAQLRGQFVITWNRDASFRKTVILTRSNLISARGYNPETGVLRFDPGDSIRFGFSWDLVADDGRSLFDLLLFLPDPQCPAQYVSVQPVEVIVEGNILLYERTGVLFPKRRLFSFRLHREYARCGNPD